MKHRNITLALVAKNDPARLRTRTVETEARKQVKSRARRNRDWKKELRQEF
jgi:hypothetical protein